MNPRQGALASFLGLANIRNRCMILEYKEAAMGKLATLTISIPPELRRWLEMEAAKETRSLSQQIVHIVNQQKAGKQRKAAEAL